MELGHTEMSKVFESLTSLSERCAHIEQILSLLPRDANWYSIYKDKLQSDIVEIRSELKYLCHCVSFELSPRTTNEVVQRVLERKEIEDYLISNPI